MIKGILFEPDTIVGGGWLRNYHQSWARNPVLVELEELQSRSDIPTLTVLVAAGWQMQYPNPTATDISNINQFILDASSHGFNILLHLSIPGIITNPLADQLGDGANHVGGHNAGDIVAGVTLLWDIPYFASETETRSWVISVLSSITPSNLASLVAVEFGGHHRVAHSVESNYFYSESVFKSAAAQWLNGTILAARSLLPQLKFGCALYPSIWKSNDLVYDQVEYAKVNIPAADFYDFTVQYPKVDTFKLSSILSPSKLIVSDFKMNLGGPTRASIIKWYLAQAELAGIYGYWIWQYRDILGDGGIRKSVSNGSQWDEKLLAIVNADCM